MKSGYYNTWTEEINDVSETDEDTTTTDAAQPKTMSAAGTTATPLKTARRHVAGCLVTS